MPVSYTHLDVYKRQTLSNGLRVIHNEDNTTQMVALNLLYDVGARDEDPDHTGFAHLLEHLMFGGSVHVPDYDTPVQNAGGENNAWTNNDINNYYITLPRQNVETGFWLESDRMLSLDFNPRSLEVQRQVNTAQHCCQGDDNGFQPYSVQTIDNFLIAAYIYTQ